MRLILIRHGETAHNRDNITLGRADVPLNDRGVAQARAVAASFTRRPAAVYTSPLRRASDTASIIAAHTAATANAQADLIEMDVGEVEHLSGEELRRQYPDFLRAWMSDACADVRMPGGETLRDVQERAWRFVEHAAGTVERGTVVAVTHNFVILTLVCRALDLPLDRFRHMRPAVGSRTTIDLRNGQARLVRFNDVAHLAASGLADDPDGEDRP